MEDVLEVYTRPYDPRKPVICLDETSKQLLGDVRKPLTAKPGKVGCYDYEYERHGVGNLFMLFEPLRGWRHVEVTDRRTKVDWALCVRELVDVHYRDAETVVLVMDNLNTHVGASLYEAFSAQEARRLFGKLEIHYTPKHGSWLNMAEIELSALGRQCLDRRIPDRATLEKEIASWETEGNANGSRVDWRFTTEDARIKLKHLYPSIGP